MSLLGATSSTLTGRLIGFDAYNLFIEQGGGKEIMLPKGAIRYVTPESEAGGKGQ